MPSVDVCKQCGDQESRGENPGQVVKTEQLKLIAQHEDGAVVSVWQGKEIDEQDSGESEHIDPSDTMGEERDK